jgi:uncharacterized protein YjbI with pentapeptide repeats/uncharacterized protein (DUF697 family)/tellurite resistance protein
MAADFSGQDLRGQSFKGQNLVGANFSSADIRGSNFSGADLTDANFSHAYAGLTHRRKTLLLAIAALLALASGGLSFLLSQCINYLLLPDVFPPTRGIPMATLSALLLFAALLSLRQGFGAFNKVFIPLLVTLVILMTFVLGSYPVWGVAIDIVALALVAATFLAQSVAITVAAAEGVRDPFAGCVIGAIAAAIACIAADQSGIEVWIPLATVALGVWGAWRSLGVPDQFAGIHRAAIGFAAMGGTCFRRANLTQTNFSQARLKNSDFRAAILAQTNLLGVSFLEQAQWGNSILQSAAVRSLLVTGNGRGQSYSEVNLQGANLSNADLSSAILRDANLSGATLQNANLEGADLTRVNAIGCNFHQARLTGACVDQWDVDRSTQLDQVDCRFVFLAAMQRLPAVGDWAAGQFSQQFTVTDQDAASIFALPNVVTTSAINPQEILASLMVLVRMAIADNVLEESEKELISDAIKSLQLPLEITVERLIDERINLETLLQKINSPLVKDKVYQSAYLMARVDGELNPEEDEFLNRLQTKLQLSPGAIEKSRAMVQEAQNLSISEQVQAITDPEKRQSAVNTNIRLMSVMHAVNGAMPIPGFAIVTHLMIYKDQVELVQKIGRIWGYPADYHSPILERALFGSVGATAARVAVSNVALLIPIWGSVVGASTAFSMTWAIGEMTNRFFSSGGELDESTLKFKFAEAKQVGKTLFLEIQAAISRQQQAIAPQIQALQQQLQLGDLSQQDYVQQVKTLTQFEIEPDQDTTLF